MVGEHAASHCHPMLHLLVMAALIQGPGHAQPAGQSGGGQHQKIVIHVPYYIKNHHHTHTVFKYVAKAQPHGDEHADSEQLAEQDDESIQHQNLPLDTRPAPVHEEHDGYESQESSEQLRPAHHHDGELLRHEGSYGSHDAIDYGPPEHDDMDKEGKVHYLNHQGRHQDIADNREYNNHLRHARHEEEYVVDDTRQESKNKNNRYNQANYRRARDYDSLTRNGARRKYRGHSVHDHSHLNVELQPPQYEVVEPQQEPVLKRNITPLNYKNMRNRKYNALNWRS